MYPGAAKSPAAEDEITWMFILWKMMQRLQTLYALRWLT
jgi:hypothetical protein